MKGLIPISALLLFAAVNLYSLTGNDVLDKVEAVLTAPRDIQGDYKMTLGSTVNDNDREDRSLKIWTMGKDLRCVKFITPASVNNVGVLALGDNEMYVYLPAYQKVRRIQGNMKDNDFQGTDFSYREMGSFNYSKDFDAVVSSETGETWTLGLKRKAGSDSPYDSIVMVVDKSNSMPKSVEMSNGGVKKKVLTINTAEKNGNYWIYRKIRMENVGNKHFTEVSMDNIVFDQGLKEKGVFTQGFLKTYVK
jgi:outer membrane lipoprotein-sorting protein